MSTKSPNKEYEMPYALLNVRNNMGERLATTDIDMPDV